MHRSSSALLWWEWRPLVTRTPQGQDDVRRNRGEPSKRPYWSEEICRSQEGFTGDTVAVGIKVLTVMPGISRKAWRTFPPSTG